MQIVAMAPAAKSIWALEEFIADTGAPFGREWNDIGNLVKMKILGVVSANDHGESVLKAEWLGDFEVKALGVKLPDAIVDGGGITSRRFVQDGGEGGAGVFNVEVELSSLEGSVDEERAAEIGFASDGDAGARFDVLGEQLSKHDLLRATVGTGGAVRVTGWMHS